MSLEAIVAAIESVGDAEVARIRAEAESRARQILDEARHKAAAIHEEARRAALRPAAGARARRLHQAKLEALRTVGEVRNRFIEAVLSETRRRLSELRAEPDYPLILRRLTEEALSALGEEDSDGSQPSIEVDPRDEAQLRHILAELGLDVSIVPSINDWGGIVARSSDERILVRNTLETRLERAAPFLGRDLATFIQKQLAESLERGELSAVL